MNAELILEPGTYVVAVSGGVDSMALLHLLTTNYQLQTTNYKLIVAHFEHGVRADSDLDRQLVQAEANTYGLPFVYDRGHLGPKVSEAAARKARYGFLHRVRKDNRAQAVVTAHHQDDVLETAIINMLRGTGWRGLSSLRSHAIIKRPLLDVPKSDLLEYAQKHNLAWREDSTNQDMRYLRNYVRGKILPKFSSAQRKILLDHIRHSNELRDDLEAELAKYIDLWSGDGKLDRQWLILLPHAVAKEIMAAWLRNNHAHNLSAKMLERLVGAAKTYGPGRVTDVDKNRILKIGKDYLALEPRER